MFFSTADLVKVSPHIVINKLRTLPANLAHLQATPETIGLAIRDMHELSRRIPDFGPYTYATKTAAHKCQGELIRMQQDAVLARATAPVAMPSMTLTRWAVAISIAALLTAVVYLLWGMR